MGNIFRQAQPFTRNLFLDLISRRIDDVGRHVSFDKPGSHRIHRDVPPGQFPRDTPSESFDAPFTGGIIRLSRVSKFRSNGRHINNPAISGRHHRSDHGMAEVVNRIEVGVDHILPLIGSHSGEQAIPDNSRVIDQNVDLFPFVEHFLHHTIRIFGRGRIGLNPYDFPLIQFQLGNKLISSFFIGSVDKGDFSPFFREGLNDGAANSSAATR